MKIPPRGEQGGRIQQRGKEKQEDQLRIQADARQAGHETKHQTAHHKKDGIGNAELAGQQREAGHRHQESQNGFNGMNHRVNFSLHCFM